MEAAVGAARSLAPLIHDHADTIESERRLPEPVVRALVDAGVFKLCVPRAFGGAEADPVTACRVVEELSRIDGSTGWCAQLGIALGFFGGLVPAQAGQEIFTAPDAVVAGSFGARGIARIVEGGYRVSGRWAFASGIGHSTWVMAGVRLYDGDEPCLTESGAPVREVVFFPTSDVEIIDTWHVTGLRGSGSHDYAVDDVFVPKHRAFWFSQPPVQDGPLFTLPAVGLFTPMTAGVALGIARHALDTLRELAVTKKPGRSQTTLREDPHAQARIGEAEGLIRGGRAFVYETLEDAWGTARTGRPLSWEQRGMLWLSATQAVNQALQAVDLMFRTGGATSIYSSLPLERCLRDIRTTAQHHIFAPINFELAGRLSMGFDLTDTFWGLDYRSDP